MSDELKNKIGGGLAPLPEDSRDFSLAGIFGTPRLPQIPEDDYFVSDPLEIKDQKNSDMCTAYATAAVSEDQERAPLEPAYIFAKTKKIEGKVDSWGANLRDACKAVVAYGSIEKTDAPFNLDSKERDFLADWKNWPLELDELASVHKKMSYFTVDGPYDTFDNIRAALWEHRDEERSIVTGAEWEPGWFSPDGIIPKGPTGEGFGHAFKIFGQMRINEEIYLVAQLSNGTGFGDKGIFYFPREVVNRKFTFGTYMFKDIDPALVKAITAKKGYLIQRFVNFLRKLLYAWLHTNQ